VTLNFNFSKNGGAGQIALDGGHVIWLFPFSHLQPKTENALYMYRVSQVLPPDRKHPLLIDLKLSKNSGMIVYRCRTFCKNFFMKQVNTSF
jgi:hypothetical protein